MLQAPVVKDAEQGLVLRIEPEATGREATLEATFERLEAQARAALRADGYGRCRVERSADLRYAGQSHEIATPLRSTTRAAIRSALAEAHMSRFGHADRRRPLEVVVARVKAIARSGAPPDAATARTVRGGRDAPAGGDCDGRMGTAATHAYRRAGRAATADLGAGDPDAVGHDDPSAAGLAGAIRWPSGSLRIAREGHRREGQR